MKKVVIVVFFLLVPGVAISQPNIDPAMMEQLQEMATCVSAIDQNEIKQIEKESKEFETKIKGLCKSGKRDEAQKKTMEYSQKVLMSPAFITLRKCTENMPAALKRMVPDMSAERITKEFKNKHVCDEI